MMKQAYTTAEVARLCHVSQATVNRWLKDRILKGFRGTERGHWRVFRQHLVSFMDKRQLPSEMLEEMESSLVLNNAGQG